MVIRKIKYALHLLQKRLTPFSSADYWEQRYVTGGNSGHGSYGCLQEFKREALNGIIKRHTIASAIELGCGDGAQLEGVDWPEYTGFDVSRQAVALCSKRYLLDNRKKFLHYTEFSNHIAEASVSLDVIYHLVENGVYRDYLYKLFNSATRFVIIYSTNFDLRSRDSHVRHRQFTDYIQKTKPEWKFLYSIPNPHKPASVDISYSDKSAADFYVFGLTSHDA